MQEGPAPHQSRGAGPSASEATTTVAWVQSLHARARTASMLADSPASLEDAREVGEEVFDGDRDAVVQEALGEQFDQCACPFPD